MTTCDAQLQLGGGGISITAGGGDGGKWCNYTCDGTWCDNYIVWRWLQIVFIGSGPSKTSKFPIFLQNKRV